jgi:uncharacterized membrane protein
MDPDQDTPAPRIRTSPEDLSFGVPDFRQVTPGMIRVALGRGWRDFLATWQFGLFFGGFYMLFGLGLWLLTVATGQTYWLMLAAFGFPLIGPFAAVGLYEISRLLERGETPTWNRVLTGVWREKDRQIPSMAAIIIVLFIFWVFLGHVIFALFMGLSVMTNISSSFEVFLTANGLMMIAAELLIGGFVAIILYAITVIGMPMLVDREVDFVTAMITSVGIVSRNAGPMLAWGAFIVLALAIGMLPYFAGLLVVLPVLGHATWHLYRSAVV